MRRMISHDTGKEPGTIMKTDVGVDADGEGGVFLSMCWHEMLTLGSVAARIPPDKVQDLIKAIQDASEEVDPE